MSTVLLIHANQGLAGVCHDLRAAGYVLGAGHGLYNGKLCLKRVSLARATMVTRDGEVVRPSKNERKELFRGLCGAAGAQIGIVTSFKVQIVNSAICNNVFVFRFSRPHLRIGESLEKWMKYDEAWGMTRTCLEIYCT